MPPTDDADDVPARPPSETAAARRSGSRGGSAACSTRARNSFGTTTPPAGEPALRAVRPGDITLLFRALTNVEYYEEALRRYDIDYYLVGGHAFYAQQEIYDIVNLLRAVASPCDEVSLAGILRSPMFGLLDETLYWLSKHEGGLSGGFWSV